MSHKQQSPRKSIPRIEYLKVENYRALRNLALVQSDYSSLTLRELAPIGNCNNSSIVSPFLKILRATEGTYFVVKCGLKKYELTKINLILFAAIFCFIFA